MSKIEACLKEYGFTSLEDARDVCLSKDINVDEIVKGVQPIAFENASWAYILGTAIAIKRALQRLLMLPRLSVSVCKHSVYLVLSQNKRSWSRAW